jgi:iron complex transport system ATP-binding protein
LSIKVSNLCFSYGERQVLDNISITAEEGQLLSIVGPNGVGKSTLFYCILGILNKYRGNITIEGSDIRGLDIRDMARLIAYVPQNHYPSFNFSVFDMVLMGTSIQVSSVATPGKNQIQLVYSALERLGILHLKNRSYTKISGGERQLALIARALVQQTRVLILDEPTANLDFGNQVRVLTQIKSLAKEGYTIVQSTHNPDQTFMFSDHVLAMLNGKVLADGPPCDVLTEELIHRLYVVDVDVQSLYRDRVRVCVPRSVIDDKKI